jgi:predicted nucleic acid-binding protein
VTSVAMSRSLAGIASLYLDSNILIYLVEGHSNLNELVLAAFREIELHEVALYTSEITVTECLNGAYRAGIEELAQEYLDLFGTENFISLLPVDSDVCIAAAREGAVHRLKTVDSIHLASATLAGCEALLTNDGGFHSTKDVEVIQLSEFASA